MGFHNTHIDWTAIFVTNIKTSIVLMAGKGMPQIYMTERKIHSSPWRGWDVSDTLNLLIYKVTIQTLNPIVSNSMANLRQSKPSAMGERSKELRG